jgi:hypothetical protein
MFIRKKASPHNPNKISIQIVENIRKADSVSQSVIRHVGVARNEEEVKDLLLLAEKIKLNLEEERQPVLPLFNPEDVLKSAVEARKKKIEQDDELNVNLKKLREEQRINEGIIDVFGNLFDELNFDKIFTRGSVVAHNATLKSCVLARIANPSSKMRTSELVEKDFAIRLPLDRIYRMMDQLEVLEERVKTFVKDSTLGIIGGKVNVLFYDITTLYFESFSEDELRKFGFSKDCKFKEVQVVLVLITTISGLPITYEIFPGNTSEVKTLLPSIQNLKKIYNVEEVEFVADRALFSDDNLQLLEDEGVKYVIAAKLKNMNQDIKSQILKIKNGELDGYKTSEVDHNGRRLIISYSPDRAAKDKKDRERLVSRLEKISNNKDTVEVKKLIKNAGTNKYLTFRVDKSVAQINRDKITADELWDGIHGVITNSKISQSEAIEKYANLWQIEESFRITKHDLKVRPVFHRESDRIKAHILICFLAYTLARQMMYRTKLQYESMSFERIRNELLAVQASILVHQTTKEKYIVPSKASIDAIKLYQILGLKRSTVPYKIEITL